MYMKIAHFLDKIPIKTKISLILVVMVSSIFISSATDILEIEDVIIQEKKTDLMMSVGFAKHIAEHCYLQFKNNNMSEDVAKNYALSIINSLHYGKDSYIFVYDYNGILLANYSRPDLIGQNRIDAVSIDNVYYVKEGINAARAGGGFYQYLFNAGGKNPKTELKLSYANGFDGWGWMIGTGTYFDDLNSQINFYIYKVCLFSIISLFLGIGLITLISRNIVESMNSWLEKIKKILESVKNQ